METELNQTRTFYIKFKNSHNIFSEYFGNGTLFVDYDVLWQVENEFNTLVINDKKITNVKYISNEDIIKDFDLNSLPENIKQTLSLALLHMCQSIKFDKINGPEICKSFSEFN
jgi:hypothetical protein